MAAAAEQLEIIDNVEYLNGTQRAAILVMYLEEAVARSLLEEMSSAEIEELAVAMASVDAVAADVIEAVVGEFVRDLYQTALVPRTGREFAMQILPDLVDDDRRERVTVRVRRRISTEFQDYIAVRPPRSVAALLLDEHPQTRAIALILMGPDNAARVMEFFDEQEQLEMTLRMPGLEAVPTEVADDVERTLRDALQDRGAGIWEVEGIDETAQIIGRLGRTLQEPLLGQVQAHDQELGSVLRQRMVRFGDLAALDDRNIAALLKNVDRSLLLPALRGAEPRMREKIFGGLTKRTAEDLQADLEIMGKLPRAEVEAAQDEIVQIAIQMRDEGSLQLASGSEDML